MSAIRWSKALTAGVAAILILAGCTVHLGKDSELSRAATGSLQFADFLDAMSGTTGRDETD